MDRHRPLGLQRRIMIYVTIGLATMFSVGAVVGSAAIDEATALVFDERLATAYTTAGIVGRDFVRVAADVESALAEPGSSAAQATATARRLQGQLGGAERYPFFQVVGICLADAAGSILAEAGTVARFDPEPGRCAGAVPEQLTFTVLRARWSTEGHVAFADLVVPTDEASAGAALTVIRLASSNRTVPFDPASYGRGREVSDDVEPRTAGSGDYALEIIDPDGLTVLGIGRHELAGGPSPHYPAIRTVMDQGTALAIVDEGDPARGLEPHVMAVVPVADTPFYLLLEQPTDVALALPIQLRERLIALVVVGFLAAATVAWFTTRRVVRPTEQLTLAAERMAQGDLASPIQVAAQDEIAALGETLDMMRTRLRDAHEELEQTNRELEQRVAERTARLEQVLRKIISAQEDERHALARELHDETAQTLAALSIALDRARDDIEQAPSGALEQIQSAKEIATRLLAETRRLILGLRPSVLDDLGLGPAIAWYAETTLADAQIALRLDLRPTRRLPQHIEVSLFRIAQEAINNVAKHAGAGSTAIELRADQGSATLSIEDDGRGFDVDQTLARAPHAGSVGLAGMQERVALLGGQLKITSQEGQGSRVVVTVPLHVGETG